MSIVNVLAYGTEVSTVQLNCLMQFRLRKFRSPQLDRQRRPHEGPDGNRCEYQYQHPFHRQRPSPLFSFTHIAFSRVVSFGAFSFRTALARAFASQMQRVVRSSSSNDMSNNPAIFHFQLIYTSIVCITYNHVAFHSFDVILVTNVCNRYADYTMGTTNAAACLATSKAVQGMWRCGQWLNPLAERVEP